ncbi:MAG: 4-hydroxyphenylacetate 3-hydroxylase N-terminal domain-containing protein [Hyphomonadaceae bacterium]
MSKQAELKERGRAAPADASAARPSSQEARPPNGKEYLASLQDDREIWIYGKRVKDVTTDPCFRNSAQSVARLYDALHAPETKDVLTCPTDTGNGGYTHSFFRATKTQQDLAASRDAIECWQRMVYGWMGRTPDYKASFTGIFGANPEHFAPFGDTARSWYRKAQEQVLFLNHAIVNPPVDRNRPVDEVEDVFVHAVKETDAGIVVRGAKVVATGSALTQANFCASNRGTLRKREYALAFFAPMTTPGVKLICRHSYELAAAATGSPFDYPLSSRLDENDAILVFDNAFIPWENVFFYGEVDRADKLLQNANTIGRVCIQAFTRLKVKLDFVIGLTLKASRIAGTSEMRSVQALIGELIMYRNTVKGLTDAMIAHPEPVHGDYITFNETYGMTLRGLGPHIYTRMRDIVQKVSSSSLIYLNSNAVDFDNAELRPYLDTYLRGSDGISAESRSKTMKLLWDSISSEFGARHELYERNYLGGHEDVLMGPLFRALSTGDAKLFTEFADQCMDEYDLSGWKLPGFHNGDDVRIVGR